MSASALPLRLPGMTPFIGVMLALLAVIVATSHAPTVEIRLDQPPMDGWRGPAPVFISVAGHDKIYVGGKRTPFAALDSTVGKATADPGTTGIVIRADQDVSYGDFIRVFNRLKVRGYAVRMMTEDMD